MKKVKLFITPLVIICLILTNITALAAGNAASITDMAATLNRLTILEGDGNGNYSLDKQLRRSEAAAFIIKLLGKESFVKANTETLQLTQFTDIPSSAWYAPYVGYCSGLGIISSNSTGKYRPDDSVSEKEFLKLTLVAIGYDYGTDFTWDTVFSKAYEIGLVTDASYLTKTQDNTTYLRSSVVRVLYNALTKVNKKLRVTMLQNLINENAVTKEEALASGIVSSDTSDITIDQIYNLDQGILLVKFSKPVNDLIDSDIKIYETADITKKLEFTIQSKQNDQILLRTANQSAYCPYTIEISNVIAAEGVFSNTLFGTFDGYKSAEIKSDFFKISKVVQAGKNSVNVYFTHPVNSNCENASYYEILSGNIVLASGSSKGLSAAYPGSPDNMVTITLADTDFQAGQQYTVKVSGALSSIYGVKLNEGASDSFRFNAEDTSGSTVTGSIFTLNKISLLDYRTVQLEFNMEVHPTRAQQVFSYYITDQYNNPVTISKAVVGGTGNKYVYLSINGAFVTNYNYTLLINEINDASKRYSIEEKQYTFSGVHPASTVLNVTSVSALDKNTVAVYFDRSLDKTAAETKTNYYITGVTTLGYYATPDKAVYDPKTNANMVKLYLPADKALTSGSSYKLTVYGTMKDSLGNYSGVNRETTFFGSGISGAKPYITDAVIISTDTVKITTSMDIALNEANISATNYSLKYDNNGVAASKTPLLVGYINKTTLVLKFDALDFSKSYTLSFNSLTDYSEIYTRTAEDGQNSITVRLGQ